MLLVARLVYHKLFAFGETPRTQTTAIMGSLHVSPNSTCTLRLRSHSKVATVLPSTFGVCHPLLSGSATLKPSDFVGPKWPTISSELMAQDWHPTGKSGHLTAGCKVSTHCKGSPCPATPCILRTPRPHSEKSRMKQLHFLKPLGAFQTRVDVSH